MNSEERFLDWHPGPIAPRIGLDHVDVWKIPLNPTSEILEQCANYLSDDERQRADRFRFQVHRNQFIAAHGVLREILSRYLQTTPPELDFVVNSYGKPDLSGDFQSQDLTFNLSHSHEWGLIAVACRRRIGVDIEFIQSDLADEQIARRFFSNYEVNRFLSLPSELRTTAFFTCWTRKEAYIKALGEGLSMPLDAFDVTLAPGEPAKILETRPDPAQALQWKLHALYPESSYVAAVCVEGQVETMNCWKWINVA